MPISVSADLKLLKTSIHMRKIEKELRSLVLLIVLSNALSLHILKGYDLLNHYDINLEINPVDKSISAEVKLEVLTSQKEIESFEKELKE
jgi:hypothetical protein